jgi:signal transduction histidine kinase
MTGHSLKIRLLTAGTVVLILALGLTGIGLITLFDRHVERRISTELDTYLTQIASRLSFAASGMPQLGNKLADPRFEKIYSGLYWQINNETAKISTHSRSLWDTRLSLPVDSPDFGKVHIHTIIGPHEASLLIHERRLSFAAPAGDQVARLIVAINRAELDKMSSDFAADVAIALLILCAFLLLAGWIQITIGLGPLSLIQNSIAAIRSGSASRMNPDMPREVLPLANQVDDLLDAQDAAIQNARHRASDMAHGFKTPLTALVSDIGRLRDRGEHEIANDIEAISQVMQRQIDRELTKARIRDVRTMGTLKVRPVIEAIIATLQRTPAGERQEFLIECDQNVAVQMDKDDLTEILGNLIENAVKHAATKTVVRTKAISDFIVFEIEDDGEGISDTQRNIVQKRGVRLDQSIAGSGLGLAIVKDVLEAYDQHLELDASPLGGLKASFRLPSLSTK